jgi:hypothetical protein
MQAFSQKKFKKDDLACSARLTDPSLRGFGLVGRLLLM